MDERFIKKLLIPSCVIVVLSAILVYELKYLIDLLLFKNKHILVIGILSSPHNFQQRLSIRRTWLQLLSEISGSAYFIIGNEICEVPPYDRADPYQCVEKPYFLHENATCDTEFSTITIKRTNPKKTKVSVPGFIGFGFYVRSNIIIKKLGIVKELLLTVDREIQVKLISAFDNTVLASATFTSDLLDENSSQILTKAVKPIKLNQNFEAYIKLEIKNSAKIFFPKCDSVQWQNEPNVINFIQLWQEESIIPLPFHEKSCTYVFFSYTVVDVDNIKEHINNRTARLKEWHRFNKKLSVKLENESKIYNDIFLVDVVDVYRNLSLKMTSFFKRIIQIEYFHYILKADDDSFLDLLRIYNQLVAVNKEIDYEIGETVGQIKETGIVARLRLSKLWWWSYFKEFWKVERSGKWREDYYKSASYPTFPCGGGYVLNRGIVDYIVSNHHHLNHFQGEDVSMGIWLSTLPVTHYKTPRVISKNNSHHLQKKIVTKFKGKKTWELFKYNKTNNEMVPNLCDWTCGNKKYSSIPLCNKVQLNIQGMYNTWKTYISRGFL